MESDKIFGRTVSQLIADHPAFFETVGRYLYYNFGGFSVSGDKEQDSILVSTKLGNGVTEYTLLHINDVQNVLLLDIQQKLREIRKTV